MLYHSAHLWKLCFKDSEVQRKVWINKRTSEDNNKDGSFTACGEKSAAKVTRVKAPNMLSATQQVPNICERLLVPSPSEGLSPLAILTLNPRMSL